MSMLPCIIMFDTLLLLLVENMSLFSALNEADPRTSRYCGALDVFPLFLRHLVCVSLSDESVLRPTVLMIRADVLSHPVRCLNKRMFLPPSNVECSFARQTRNLRNWQS